MSGATTSTTTVLRLREARNRMLDALRLGETYPVRDLPVPNERLTVAFNDIATIKVESSEKGVEYGLRNKAGDAVGATLLGTGATVALTTPPIRDDVTFTIHARAPSGREADLLETAGVKVGLDGSLAAILLPQDGPSPRVLDYNTAVTVRLPSSQDGVDYRLVRFAGGDPANPEDVAAAAQDDIVSVGNQVVRGTGGPIELPSKPLQADTEIRIRATKTFDAALARPPQTKILAIRLPVFVRANPDLVLTPEPGAVVDFQAVPKVKLAAAQSGVEYRAVMLRLPDAAFAQGAAPGPGLLAVPVPGQPDAMIRLPPLATVDPSVVPQGFTLGIDWQAGGNADLRLTLPLATADSVIAIAAHKTHTNGAASFSSWIWLRQILAVLVRPNPRPELGVTVTLAGAASDGAMTIAGGQPGVYYTPRPTPPVPGILPAYVHQRSPDDPAANKGIGQLELEVDFAVARDGQPPLPPIVDTGAAAVGSSWTVGAMVAQSRVGIDLPNPVVIAAVPAAQLTAGLIDRGGIAHVAVPASAATDSYALFQEAMPNDVAIGAARDGNGQALDFASAAIANDTVLVLSATSKAPIPVRRRMRFTVAVRPDPSCPVRAGDAAVPAGNRTKILVDRTQTEMSYQLVAAGAPVGAAQQGNGDTLVFITDPIGAATTFSITATRINPPAATATLAATAAVTLKPN
ncbi:hypothetical protein SSBR45G_11990 [Bradyrhizobium sp. SSBR45G]|uniref:hypothetical protein n=1 Tax=unclassified Bradyrhizobium TaxID=2631580 RepID=UPI00234293A8|nr:MULTISPECIES: hypothetical protein [unclassified Bradyrhizobium]GLH76291.1 hypothetical protein SSBR45G_11990 [Bradyrhizobium sp. SSBR45G]GLH83226.1 hypothetical protein SSBR45R_06860 [Bradyrhizobium sp. SSBR45R]